MTPKSKIHSNTFSYYNLEAYCLANEKHTKYSVYNLIFSK